jgi:hypothetical protein
MVECPVLDNSSTIGQERWLDEFRLAEDIGRRNSVVLGDVIQKRARPYRLARDWKRESSYMSSVSDMMNLRSFKDIVSMGHAAVPPLVQLLQREPYHWFIPLQVITGENPVDENARGDFQKITHAWLSWSHSKGYLC